MHKKKAEPSSDLLILTPQQMASADRTSIASGISGLSLMEAAGTAVADFILQRYASARSVTVLCGTGNNGGDGLVAARHLKATGMNVRLLLNGDQESIQGEAAQAAKLWPGSVGSIDDWDGKADLVVDAIFGTGLSRDVEGRVAKLMNEVNDTRLPVVAVDIPSGVDGHTGQVRGVAFKAEATVTFARLKPCHFLMPGRALCGERVLADIGIPDEFIDAQGAAIYANRPKLWIADFPVPGPLDHKYTRGHTAIATGGALTTGASRLAARAALRIGAGLVTAVCPREAAPILSTSLEAPMVRVAETSSDLAETLADRRISAVVFGPGAGFGLDVRSKAQAVLESGKPTVLDADALTSFRERTEALGKLIKINHNRQVVVTPHEGEFERLVDSMPPITADRAKYERAQALAVALGATVILKGADTVVAEPKGRCSISDNAPPWLATAGAGDVLAGMVGGLMAQGMSAFEAASAAVWIHGEAAALVGPGLISEDLPDAVPAVLNKLLEARSLWRYRDPLQ